MSFARGTLFWFALLAVAALVACGDGGPAWTGSIEAYLRDQPERFGTVMRDPAKHRVQIIYTQIDRNEENRPSFRSFRYRVNEAEYFYPASTVKLPVALLALEKLRRLNVPGLDRDTPMLTGAAESGQTAALTDATSPSGLPSVGHYVRKILLVSDNDAYNRLYEFLGQEPLNEALLKKGYTGVRIMHRLELVLDPDANGATNPLRFEEDGRVLYEQPAATSERSFLAADPILLGQAEIVGDVRLERPKDFAEKNALPLQALHDILLAALFPDAVDARRRFDLDADDYRFLYRNMSAYPSESGIAAYLDGDRYPDGFVKFLMFGGTADDIPRNIRIFNKVGDAYGFLTDAAYIVDFEAGVEFILAATVYVNENETFNDNEYEYDDLGLPFLRELGQAFYELELVRDRPRRPDLAAFRFHEYIE